jgi:hypothetical protein
MAAPIPREPPVTTAVRAIAVPLCFFPIRLP